MSTVVLKNVSKQFGKRPIVNDVALHVNPGEIFGLLGPNGAGKTTIIRMMLDVIRPDTGQITIFDGPMTEAKKERIGYLPEERGLYADIKLMEVILYLATLKGMARKTAVAAATAYLKQLDLWEHKDKKMNALSRGMHQKAQFIVTILHNPDLIIVDEPFSGLDPVNTELIRQMLLDFRQQGKAIIMSTHQMHQVQAMCDRITLLHNGQAVLTGSVDAVRRQFAGNTIEVKGTGDFDQLPQVQIAQHKNGLWHLTLHEDTSPQTFLQTVATHPDMALEHFSVALPSLHEIFIRVVGENDV